jgi:proteic killer suppression protein
MIKGFAHKGLEQFFTTGSKAGIQPKHATKLRLILAQLHQAQTLEDLSAPALGLHSLRGNRQGQWAVTVQANWRITFKFEDGNADAVNYEDYH